jgi:HSP20 family protein
MARLIRRAGDTSHDIVPHFDPVEMIRDFMTWDPFAEMRPSLAGRDLATFSPRFDVKETKDAYIFRADLPGIEEKDLEITMTGNRLTVSGSREAEQRAEGDTYYAYERGYGSFSRSFTLPDGADVDRADADLRNGVLTVTVPKKPEHRPRRISLQSLGEKIRGALGAKEKGTA